MKNIYKLIMCWFVCLICLSLLNIDDSVLNFVLLTLFLCGGIGIGIYAHKINLDENKQKFMNKMMKEMIKENIPIKTVYNIAKNIK